MRFIYWTHPSITDNVVLMCDILCVQCIEMDEEESTERQMQIAMLCQRLAKMKQLFNDGNKIYICVINRNVFTSHRNPGSF